MINVAIATRFLETPYLWGGRSGFGIDCSGLVQLAMQMAGAMRPRFDMQASGLGRLIEREDLARETSSSGRAMCDMEDEKTWCMPTDTR